MSSAPPLPPFSVIIVAAGKGLRAGQPLPKQFAIWKGKPVLRHSVDAFLESGASRVLIAIPEGADAIARQAAGDDSRIAFITGGETRQQSVGNALGALGALDAHAVQSVERVLIHDAARPIVPMQVIDRLLAALNDHPGAVPVLPVVDSLAVSENGVMTGSADRDALRRVQTPQAFRYDAILAAHRAWQGEANAGDDAQVLRADGGTVALVEGDEALHKLTFSGDFMSALPQVRTGMGYDVHRLADGEELWLCGIKIEHSRGLAGHSDADVGLHAITDAILGAVAMGDIGQHFPPSDQQWAGASSDRFLAHAAKLAAEAGYDVGNIDLTLICEEPKIGPHRAAMQARIAQILQVEAGAISVKATTTERLGFTGRGEGIAAQAVATMTLQA